MPVQTGLRVVKDVSTGGLTTEPVSSGFPVTVHTHEDTRTGAVRRVTVEDGEYVAVRTPTPTPDRRSPGTPPSSVDLL